MEHRKLFDLKERPALLGYGCMRFPMKDGEVDEIPSLAMIDRAIAGGVNYFDTAYGYLSGKSEPFVGRALKRYPRESVYIATKLPVGRCNSVDEALKIFDDQLSRLQIDYFDFYLFHGLNGGSWDRCVELGIFDAIHEKQKQGIIRNLGFSFHGSSEDFVHIINARKWDFCQVQINYMDRESQSGIAGCELAEKLGTAVIVMEPVKGGSLAAFAPAAAKIFTDHAPEASLASWAMRWVAGQSFAKVVLSGMSEMSQVEDNLKTFNNFKPLTAQEHELVEKVVVAIRESIMNGCTTCKYCMPCPAGVDIPRIFSLWNDYGMYRNLDGAKWRYSHMPEEAKADKCTKCGACEKLCPQEVKIREDLEKFTELMGV